MTITMLSEEEALALLKKHSPNLVSYGIVWAHSKAVQKTAMDIAKKIKGADTEFIKIACLLHDIGRFTFPPHSPKMIRHGIEGAKILKKEKLDQNFQRVCERHLGCGIRKSDIIKQKLPLPKREFIPRTINEKIISYADNLIFGARKGTIREVVKRYREELGKEHAERMKKQHQEIMKLIK